MGVCHECAVTIDGVPGLRSCMVAATPGMDITQQAALPPAHTAPDAGPTRSRSPDVLVIGAGPAGMTAAATAAEIGLDVVLVDERLKLGGQYFKQPARSELAATADSQHAAGRALIERVRAADIQVLSGTMIWGAFGVDTILGVSGSGRWRFSPRTVILATGAYERAVPLPGWTLPGVMTTGAAQTLLRSYGVTPGERVLISGNGPLAMQVAAEITRAGARVVALTELARLTSPRRLGAVARMAGAAPDLIRDGARYRLTLARARVPTLLGHGLVRVEGDDAVRRATVAAVDSDGRPDPATERSFDVDAVCMGFGFDPSNEIARALGCRHRREAQSGALVTEASETGRTSVPGVWAVGDGTTIGGARVAQSVAVLAAIDAARALGRDLAEQWEATERAAMRAARRHRRFQTALAQLYAAPRLGARLAAPRTLICRCENVTREAIESVARDGLGHVGAIKRATRAGMGPCQGRYCEPLVREIIAEQADVALDEYSGFAPNPPFKPVPISVLRSDTDTGRAGG
jgi:NADPH-dependent 2,4-dienoyl-CoA reductase/sulfur reductase-like enzyme